MLSHFASKKVVCCASWATTKDVYMLDVRIGGFEMAENLLHKHVNGILVWFKSFETMTML